MVAWNKSGVRGPALQNMEKIIEQKETVTLPLNSLPNSQPQRSPRFCSRDASPALPLMRHSFFQPEPTTPRVTSMAVETFVASPHSRQLYWPLLVEPIDGDDGRLTCFQSCFLVFMRGSKNSCMTQFFTAPDFVARFLLLAPARFENTHKRMNCKHP